MLKSKKQGIILSFILFLICCALVYLFQLSIFRAFLIPILGVQVALTPRPMNGQLAKGIEILLLLGVVFIHLFVLEVSTDTSLFAVFLCSLFFFLGSLCNQIPYNPWIGIRIPSTRNDEGNWKATHQFLAYLSYPVSFLTLLLYPHLDMNLVVAISFSAWIALPLIYSIWIYPRIIAKNSAH